MVGYIDFDVVMNYFVENTRYRLRRYKFPFVELKNDKHQVELALLLHNYCLITIDECCEINCTRYYHWIAVRHGVVFDSLCIEPCKISSYVSKLDAVYFVDLNPDRNFLSVR